MDPEVVALAELYHRIATIKVTLALVEKERTKKATAISGQEGRVAENKASLVGKDCLVAEITKEGLQIEVTLKSTLKSSSKIHA